MDTGKSLNHEQPEIEFDSDDYTFVATLHDNESMDKKGIQKTSEKTVGERLVDGLADELVDFGVNEHEFRTIFGVNMEDFRSKFGVNILKTAILLSNDPNITAKEIAEKLNLSKRTAENYLSKLKANNIIERAGSDKTGYWKIIKGSA